MLHTFTETQVKNAIVKTLNRNYEFIAQVGRYISADDIENVEVWFIGLRVKFKPGVYKYRYRMVSKARVCEKLSPNKQEVTFTLMGKSVSDRLHLATYFYKWDDSQVEHIWTVSLGYNTKQEVTAMQYWLFKKQKAAHSVVRSRQRTKSEWELKVWGIDGDLLTELMTKDKDWHEVCRQQISSLGVVNKHEYKPRGWQTEYTSPQPKKREPIRIIKPNGAYRFMQGETMLIAVYSKEEVAIKIKEYLTAGYSVELEDPKTNVVYQAAIDGDKLKYKPISQANNYA